MSGYQLTGPVPNGIDLSAVSGTDRGSRRCPLVKSCTPSLPLSTQSYQCIFARYRRIPQPRIQFL